MEPPRHLRVGQEGDAVDGQRRPLPFPVQVLRRNIGRRRRMIGDEEFPVAGQVVFLRRTAHPHVGRTFAEGIQPVPQAPRVEGLEFDDDSRAVGEILRQGLRQIPVHAARHGDDPGIPGTAAAATAASRQPASQQDRAQGACQDTRRFPCHLPTPPLLRTGGRKTRPVPARLPHSAKSPSPESRKDGPSLFSIGYWAGNVNTLLKSRKTGSPSRK